MDQLRLQVHLGGAEGRGRAPYQSFIENLVAQLGDQAHPRLILEKFKESGLGGGSKNAVEAILSLMNEMTSEGEHFSSVLEEEDALVMVLLESATMGQDLLLSWQMILMNAMRAPPAAPNGEKGSPSPIPDPIMRFHLANGAQLHPSAGPIADSRPADVAALRCGQIMIYDHHW